ncbi:MAG: ATP phosphoribosyltransferase regulatory subunit [Oscillospiraceae bacterium]|nr:ATP phosphoribosyltransferase regulatory subunit [Oscillospiraceae bacterium]
MPDWKLHTPNGVNDVLPDECAVKKDIESTIWTVFASFGYKEIESPSFEYYDCYSSESGQISQEKLFKFFDEQGRILALRPDFTTSIARMAATKAQNEKPPVRYMYNGSVYRAEHTEGVRSREITQSGIELIGSYSAKADAEVIAAAMEAILALGIDEFSMEIGQVAFFNGLVEQLGLDAETTEKLRERIDSKDSQGIKSIVDKLKIADNIKKVMIDLPYLFGDASIIDRANVPGLNETSKIALDNLRNIYEILCLYGFEKYISLDLGMLQSIDYYTGSIFKCYTYGVGFPIAAGGRYDNLMGSFGSPKGAVGCAIGINRIMQVYKGERDAVPGTLVFAEKNAEGLGYEVASNLRVNGCLTEMYIGGGDFEDSEEYAKATNNTCILRVYPNGRLVVYDLERDDTIDTTVNEFLGYGEAFDAEPTPQDLGFRRI